MRMNGRIKKRIILAFIILIYNILGLISLLGLYPNDPFYWDSSWSFIIFILTYPIIIISFTYRYMQPNTLYPIYIIQSIFLILTLYWGDFMIRRTNAK